MKLIITYLLFVLLTLIVLLFIIILNLFKINLYISNFNVPIICIISGGFGGILYLLRAIYIQKCVKKDWDKEWYIWYYLRPLTSSISGGVAYLFLKAGLITLESKTMNDSSFFGFYALSFIAGLNVDNFVKKIEDIAESVWGIKKSRTSSSNVNE